MSTRRNALGRGLGALIPGRESNRSNAAAAEAPISAESVTETATSSANATSAVEPDSAANARLELPVDRIDPNPEQPRRLFDPKQLETLAASIQRHGVLQPVVVRRAGDRYELIVGERRWRASRAAGLKTIPAVVADVAPQERLEIAIVENVQRHDLNPIELAHAYRALADAGATQDQIGRRVSLDRSSIANHLRLLELSRGIQEDVETGRLTMGHAKALLQVSEPTDRQTLRDRVVAEGLSVRETEKLGRRLAGPAPARRRDAPPTRLSPDLARALEVAQRRLQTRIQLKGGPEKGRLEIEYFDAADLDRILSLLLGDA
jgi:ParB family chromosome partitioning protein